MKKTTRVNLPSIFLMEFITYLILIGLLVLYAGVTRDTVTGLRSALGASGVTAQEGGRILGTLYLSLSLYSLAFFVAVLAVWVLSRHFIWKNITGKRAKRLIKALLLAIPFTIIQWALIAGFFLLVYKALVPVLILNPPWLAMVLAFAIIIVLTPVLFNIAGFSNLAYYWLFKHDDWRLLGCYAFPSFTGLKLPSLKKWEFGVLKVSAAFIVLTVLLSLVNLLPDSFDWIIILVLYSIFIAWSKFYFVNKVFAK